MLLSFRPFCTLYVLLAGVRQGCSLSPLLLLIYDDAMIREATDNMETWNFSKWPSN